MHFSPPKVNIHFFMNNEYSAYNMLKTTLVKLITLRIFGVLFLIKNYYVENYLYFNIFNEVFNVLSFFLYSVFSVVKLLSLQNDRPAFLQGGHLFI